MQKTQLCSTIIVPPHSTLKLGTRLIIFKCSLVAKSFQMKSRVMTSVQKGEARWMFFWKNVDRASLVPWHLSERPTESLGPWVLVCIQHYPALTFYEATCRNPRPSQNLLFLPAMIPATSMDVISQYLWSPWTGKSSRTCHTG